jgi:hypothetical protein
MLMSTKTLMLFHMNLSFSSIEEKSRKVAIEKCYRPLLDFAKISNIRVAIEASAFTLLEIQRIAPDVISLLISLIKNKKIEFIGSGYVQLISAIVPYQVNCKNIEIGIQIYEDILGLVPRYMLVNEMAYSRSIVDIMLEYQFQGVIIEKNNVEYACKDSIKKPDNILDYDYIEGAGKNSKIEVIWIDSVLFQKFQLHIHGVISYEEYKEFIKKAINSIGDENLLVIYGSDAEVFDYRPGRFNDEAIIVNDEWSLIQKTALKMAIDLNLEYILPSKFREQFSARINRSLQATNIAFPIVVKKQFYYNLSRWAVTGRADFWINAACYSINSSLIQTNANIEEWKKLCFFWSSDFRTHITLNRWSDITSQIKKYIKSNVGANGLKEPFNLISQFNKNLISRGEIFEKEKANLNLKSIDSQVRFTSGSNIEFISFKNQKWDRFIRSFHLGDFASISFAKPLLCNTTFIYSPKLRIGGLDRQKVLKSQYLNEINIEGVFSEVQIGDVSLGLSVINSVEHQSLFLVTKFYKDLIGDHIVRLFGLQFDLNQVKGELNIATHNGGKDLEHFPLNMNASHSKSPSFTVSCSNGFGGTEGIMYIYDDHDAIKLSWDTGSFPLFPMIDIDSYGQDRLFGIQFSVSEIDDTCIDHKLSLEEVMLRIQAVDRRLLSLN